MSGKQEQIITYLKTLTEPLNQMIQSCNKIIENIKNTKNIEEFEQITATIEKKKNENDTYKKNEESKTGKLINFLSGAPKQGFKGVLNLGKGILGTAGLAVGTAGAASAGVLGGVLGGVQGAAAGAAGYNDTGMFKGATKGARFATPVSYFTKTKAKATASGGKKTKKHNKRKKTQKRQKIQKRQKKTYKK